MTELWLPPRVSESYRKSEQPKTGEAFGPWAGRDLQYMTMPGGAVLQFDLSRLTLADYRMMRDHYQINASLSVLSFMMHQLDWTIECESQKIADHITENLTDVWTPLTRAMSQAFWAGYGPAVLQWENDTKTGRTNLTKVKDLIPEESAVHWQTVEGWAPPGHAKPKLRVYNGIAHYPSMYPVPILNSLWYPALMENGDYYGRKLLKPAFPSWFFSILMHLFSNRYFERFGEPTPIGRADWDQMYQVDGQSVSGRAVMENMLSSLRSRSVVSLPNEQDDKGNFMWDIKYLESEMRGADFERYMYRLDEEMSLAIFTPTLLMRTADVGSYNLGVGHMQVYMWMLNAIAGDWKSYIDPHIIDRMKTINFGERAPKARWVPRKMGKDTVETYQAIVRELIRTGAAGVDLTELGTALGLKFHEIKQIVAPPVAPTDPNAPPAPDPRAGRQRPQASGPRGVGKPRATAKSISNRVATQVSKAMRDGSFDRGFIPSLGYRRQMEEALVDEGCDSASAAILAANLYSNVERWLNEAIGLGASEFGSPETFVGMLDRVLDGEVDDLLSV